jgi:high-affinity nickel-transport protein
MGGSLAVLALGFFLGVRHATDPDHVIAVTTIVSRERSARGAALIGAAWGLGHTLTILVVGSGILLFSWVISPRLGLSLEFAVGLMLVMLGLLAIRDVWPLVRPRPAAVPDGHDPVHSHAHSHGDYIHTHPHQHDPETHPHQPDQTPVNWLDRHLGGVGLYRLVRPLVVGMVHGLAGSATLMLAVLSAARTLWEGLAYILLFGLGSILGMTALGVLICLPFSYSDSMGRYGQTAVRGLASLGSIGFGLAILFR